jgi:predicted amidophosphoribosyltransferase
MSLAKCKNCPNKLADKARYCPECGYPVDEKFNVTPEDFLRDTVNKGKTDKISPDSGQPMLLLEHQGHEYLWDEENFGVWIDKSILEGIDREAAQVVFENLAEEDQRYFNQAKEHIKLRSSGLKSPISENELDEHHYKALVIDEDFETKGIWLDSSVISFWYAATQNKDVPALTQVEELLHILVHLKFLED